MGISEGEARAVSVRARALVRYPGSRCNEVRNVPDNFCAIAVISGRRAQHHNLNAVSRQMAACGAAVAMRVK